jgi:hypothetical protein
VDNKQGKNMTMIELRGGNFDGMSVDNSSESPPTFFEVVVPDRFGYPAAGNHGEGVKANRPLKRASYRRTDRTASDGRLIYEFMRLALP